MLKTTNYQKATELLNQNKIGIIPTDTIYGISCLYSNPQNIEAIYSIKQRDLDKPFILLINSIKDLELFDIRLNSKELEIVNKYWPGPVSIILNVNDDKFKYLHRGTKALAFRLPLKQNLNELLQKTGPIVSTSANISGNSHIKDFLEAEKIFNNKVDFILDEGDLNNNPSKIIKIQDDTEFVIRA